MKNKWMKGLALSGITSIAAACGATGEGSPEESVESTAEAVSACACANGADQRGTPIPASATYCGFRVCGGDHKDYECTGSGWSAVAGSSCGYGACRCTGGSDDQGRPIDPSATECGYRVCGGDHQFYTCQSSGWTGTGLSCSSSGSSSGAVCVSAQVGAYCGNDNVQNGVASTLYQCPGAGQAPTSSQVCGNGCTVAPTGTADFCAGGGTSGSCSAAGQAALAWEASQLAAGHSYSNLCLGFVEGAYHAANVWPTWLSGVDAVASMTQAEQRAGFVPWSGSCPCGAVIYWPACSLNGNDGHVAICNGDGTASTSGWPGYAGATHASIASLSSAECGLPPVGYLVP